MNATNTKSNAIALLGALLLATAAAPAAAAGNSGAPSPRSGLNASMAQRDAMALLGVLMLAGASNPSRGSTLGVVLLVVAADGVRVPARMPSEPSVPRQRTSPCPRGLYRRAGCLASSRSCRAGSPRCISSASGNSATAPGRGCQRRGTKTFAVTAQAIRSSTPARGLLQCSAISPSSDSFSLRYP
jgi:hypothetical protein